MTQIRLLYSSNAPWASSGYGVQGMSLLPRLAELPELGGREQIGIFAWYGLQGGIHEWEGFRIYPAGMDAYGNDIIERHVRHFGANVVITLIDAWVMQEVAQKVAPGLYCPWVPIDHDPIPAKVLAGLQGAHTVLSYSRWGSEMLAEAGLPNVYIPHGIETGIFRVMEDEEPVRRFKHEAMGQAGHLSVMVAANKGFPDRKAFQVQVQAWARFAANKPEARLYLHTEPTMMYQGIDLPSLCRSLGIEKRVIFPDRYHYFLGLPPDYMALMYNAADVYLGAAMAEGFGIPIIEAQACGTPVVVTDFSAMPELVRWGYTTKAAHRFYTPMEAWQAWPDERAVYEGLESLYAEWHANGNAWRPEQRRAASQAIHGEYSWDTIVREDWRPLVADLAAEAPDLRSGPQPRGLWDLGWQPPRKVDPLVVDVVQDAPVVSRNGDGEVAIPSAQVLPE